MKALVQETYGPLDGLRLVERANPAPSPASVLIRVRAAGVDPGVWHMMTGRPRMMRIMGLGFSGPKVPVAGWDAAGVVEAVGQRVTRFKAGDEVFGNCGLHGTGTFAEYAALPESQCAPKPAHLTFEEAAVLPVSGCTALQAVRNAGKVRAGASVLILGAGGGVGHFALQIAKSDGAMVTAVCGTAKLEWMRALGADDVIDYTRERLGDGSRRWDVIIDTAGRRSFAELRRVLAPDGAIVVVGGEGGNVWTGGFIERMLSASVLSLLSSQRMTVLSATVNATDLLTLKELTEAGKVKPVISCTYRLDQARQALEALEQGHTRGKSVIAIA